MTVIGMLGVGAMGSAVMQRLTTHGVRVVTAAEGRSAQTRARIERSGGVDVGTVAAVVDEADAVLSIMGSRAAADVAAQVRSAVVQSSSRLHVFIECNLIAPSLVEALAAELSAFGVEVIDAGIVGPPPTAERSPTFYASGPDLGVLDVLSVCGLDIVPVGDRVGQATVLKLTSAAVWQGALALATEVMLVARRHGVGDHLWEDLRRNQALIAQWFEAALPEAPERAGRWMDDMLVISAAMAESGSSGRYHAAAAELYRRMAADPTATDAEHILSALAPVR